MKKIFCLLMALVMLMGATGVFAEETQELPEIDFRGVKLGSTLAEMQTVLEDNPYNAETYCGTDLSDIMFDTYYLLSPHYTHPENPVCFLEGARLANGRNVAGYEATYVGTYFVRPVTDGVISTDNAETVFYAGSYGFEGGDIDTMVDDLEKKLTTLYGTPEKQKVNDGTALIWYGANDTAISLWSYGRYPYVGLSYVWLGAETLIEEARNAYDPAPVDNTNNYNGL